MVAGRTAHFLRFAFRIGKRYAGPTALSATRASQAIWDQDRIPQLSSLVRRLRPPKGDRDRVWRAWFHWGPSGAELSRRKSTDITGTRSLFGAPRMFVSGAGERS
jgi:hypothetical protein